MVFLRDLWFMFWATIYIWRHHKEGFKHAPLWICKDIAKYNIDDGGKYFANIVEDARSEVLIRAGFKRNGS